MSFKPLYKKRDWVPNMIDLIYESMDALCNNPRAVQELESENLIDYYDMVANPGAIDIIERNLYNMDDSTLETNPAAAHLFKKFSENHARENNEYSVDYREELNIYDGYTPRIHLAHGNGHGCYKKWGNTLDITLVALNPQGIHYLEDEIDFDKTKDINLISNLCWNHRAIHLLEKIEKRNPNLLDFDVLVGNINAVPIIERNLHKLVTKHAWDSLSFNENAVHIMRKNMDKICWSSMSQNASDDAIQLLKENPDKIDWKNFNLNYNEKAMEMLKKNPDKINMYYLSNNPGAIDILEEHVKNSSYKLSGLSLKGLAANPSIFVLDTHAMKLQINKPQFIHPKLRMSFAEELLQKTLHPDRVSKYLHTYDYDMMCDEYVDTFV
jgi:hypothetical protein